MNYNRLETSLIDVIKEEQAKLGYMKEKISLYYPLSSLNHFFESNADAAGMMEILKDFPGYMEEKFGEVVVSHKGDRFCFTVSDKASEYVHNNMKDNENVEKDIEIKDGELENDAQATENKEEKNAEPTVEEQLDAAKKEIEALKDKYLRSVAEFDNYKKRTIKEKAELILNGSEKAVSAILPILDDFERALANKTDDAEAMKEGMKLIFNKFNKTLESLGVTKIETEGKDFDVDFHEAVAMVPGMGDDKKGKVIDCVQTGYQLNDKVIRHAKVAVGQ